MQISALSTNNLKMPALTSKTSFEGLTKTMERKVWVLPREDAQKLMSNYNKAYLVVGYFPKDILAVLKAQSSSPRDLNNRIRLFNMSLSKIAPNITSYDNKVFEQVNNINIENYLYKALLKFNKGYVGFVNEDIKYYLTSEEKEKVLNTEEFSQTMKKIGIIPKDGQAKISFVGEGTYKNCFKLEFLDAAGKNIVHPKAFVIEKNPEIGEQANNLLNKNIQKYLNNIGYDKFNEIMTEKINKNNKLTSEEKKIALSNIKPFFYDRPNCSVYNSYYVMHEFFDINGIFAEANAALKIRKDIGGKNIGKSNMIEPYCYDLRNKWGLLEFADNGLEWSSIHYDFDKHGLVWGDKKDYNYSANRDKIVDYGCIYGIKFKDKYFQYD